MVRDPLQTNSSPAGPKWALCAAFVLAMLVPEVAAAQLTLERVVLVSRHGVRAPTNSAALSDYTASQTWPTWPVAADGDLTPRGEELASLMGDYYRRHFAAFGVLPAHGCPAPNQVYVWADVDQRTRHTGNALLAGAFPGCGLYAQHLLPTHQLDPLFHPVGAGVCQIDKERARAEILKAAGGSLEHKLKQQPYSGALKRLQAVLDCCKPKLCKAQGVRCTLEVVPSEIVERGNSVGLSGPISIGSTTTEVFLLEYAQGMPQVAWGRASTPAEFVPLMWLHSLQFELIQRTNHIARRQGSALVYQVVETLRQTAERRPTPGRPAPPDSKLVVYVGHDTNLANIGGMLNVDWRLKSYLPNETPPAGAMAFELLRDMASGQYFVRMAYYSQTPGQMRSVSQLSAALPPDRADILPACRNPRDGACPWSEFAVLAMNALDMDCVVATPR